MRTFTGAVPTTEGGMVARFARGVLLVLLLVVASGYLVLPLRDPDFFWHLKTGEWIVEHRSLPQTLPFRTAPKSEPNALESIGLNSYWVSQVLLAAVHTSAGTRGIVLLRILLFLLLLLACRAKGDRLVALSLLVLGGFVFAAYPQERPQYVSFLFAALLLRLLRMLREPGPGGERRMRIVGLAVPLLLLVWANMHGGYVVGLAFMGITVVVESLKLVDPRLAPLAPRQLRLLLLSCTTGFAASLANPNGALILTSAVVPGWARASNVEYQSSLAVYRHFGDPTIVAFWVILALATVGVAFCRRTELGEAALLLATGSLATVQSRFIPFFVVAALPATVRALSSPAIVRPARVATAAAALACGALFAGGGAVGTPLEARCHDVDERFFPVEAAALVEREGLQGNIFSHYDWGGYVLWRLAPARVFIDGRNTDQSRFEAYERVLAGTAGERGRSRRALFAAAEIHCTITDFADPFTGAVRGLLDDLLADPGWAPVFASAQAVVFAERTPNNIAAIRRSAIPLNQFAGLLYRATVLRVAQYPTAHQPRITQGDLLLRRGELGAALAAYREALRLAPNDPTAVAREAGLRSELGR